MDGRRDGRYLEVWIALFSMLSCYGRDTMLENVKGGVSLKIETGPTVGAENRPATYSVWWCSGLDTFSTFLH
jgi:hypothetical protein